MGTSGGIFGRGDGEWRVLIEVRVWRNLGRPELEKNGTNSSIMQSVVQIINKMKRNPKGVRFNEQIQ